MELWIRSQDREMLIKVFEVRLNWQNDNEIICNSYTSDCCDYDYRGLGTYASKERALEVLNGIHQRLIDLQTLEIAPDFYKTTKRDLDCVYEMPKE